MPKRYGHLVTVLAHPDRPPDYENRWTDRGYRCSVVGPRERRFHGLRITGEDVEYWYDAEVVYPSGRIVGKPVDDPWRGEAWCADIVDCEEA